MNPDAPAYISSKAKRTPPPAAPAFVNPVALGVTVGVAPVGTVNPATKLRAVAKPFEPKTTSPSSPQIAAPPPPVIPPPEYTVSVRPPAALDTSDYNRRLNVGAAPYTPTKVRSSPTSVGAPAYGEGGPFPPAPPMPVAANLQPANFVTSLERAGSGMLSSTSSSLASPMSPPAKPLDPFAKSALIVPATPKAPPAEPMRFNVAWTLWADDHPLAGPGEQKNAQYQEPVHVRDVGDLETFWRLWWHTPQPSVCTPSWTYNWFRKDVKPVWEDPRNKNGGTFTFVVYDNDKAGGLPRESMDDVFTLVMLGLSGESLTEAAAVNGVSLKIRPYRPVVMQVWTNCSDESRLRNVAAGVRAVVGRVLPPKQTEKLEFFSHGRLHAQAAQPAVANRFGKAKASKALDADFTL